MCAQFNKVEQFVVKDYRFGTIKLHYFLSEEALISFLETHARAWVVEGNFEIYRLDSPVEIEQKITFSVKKEKK